MQPTLKPYLYNYLRSVSDDAMFLFCSLSSTQKAERDTLVEMANRRSNHYATIVQGSEPDSADWSTWMINMCVALAPVAPPMWLPIHEVIDSLTLESGARGVRSLLGFRKPSEKQVERARATGAFAARALASVMDAGTAWSDDDQLLRRCVVSSLGLPEEDAWLLSQEAPQVIDELEVPTDLDPKIAKRIACGVWRVVFRDGLNPRRDELAMALSQRMGLTPEDTEGMRKQARDEVDVSKAVGAAVVDAVRYVLSDDDEIGPYQARVVSRLVLPPVHQGEQFSAIEHGGAVVLARRHALERKQREVCLAIAWFVVLGSNPEQTRLAELMVRHDRVAGDLGSVADGALARSLASTFVHDRLISAVQAGGL